MNSLSAKVIHYLSTARRLWKLGLSPGSILLLPLHRRFFGKVDRIRLRGGPSITAPVGERLLELVTEIWMERRYGTGEIFSGDTVIDIGANVGVFALFAGSKRIGARVIAVEPSPRAYEYLTHNLAANKECNIVAVRAACGAQSGQAVLYRRGPDVGNCLYSAGDNYGSTFNPLDPVQVLTLDELFARFHVSQCRLLKLDCEGAEYEILYAASQTTLAAIDRIAMEYHIGLNAHRPEELSAFLQSHGFIVDCGPLLDPEGGYLYAHRISRAAAGSG